MISQFVRFVAINDTRDRLEQKQILEEKQCTLQENVLLSFVSSTTKVVWF